MWWDRTIPPGKTYDVVIEEALDIAGCVITVWTASSVRSRWVKIEANEGFNRGVLVPVLFDDVEPPLAFRAIQAADLKEWESGESGVGFSNLVAAVNELVPRARSEGTTETDVPPQLDAVAASNVARKPNRRVDEDGEDLRHKGQTPGQQRTSRVSPWWIAAAVALSAIVGAIILATLGGGSDTPQTEVSSATSAAETSTEGSDDPATTTSRAPSATEPVEPLLLEAEAGIITEPMALQADAGASGNVYVSSPEAGSESDDLGGWATVGFRIEEPGIYEVWGRVSVDEDRPTGSDSMFVTLDEGAEDVWDFFEDDPGYRGWSWDLISLRCGGAFDAHRCNPWLTTLDQGDHVLAFRNRDPGSRLDALWIVREDSSEPPPAVSP